MAYEIEWTQNAIEDLKSIVEYLRDKWSLEVATQFVDKMDNVLEILSESPHTGRLSQKRSGIRQILITRHNRLYYCFKENKIILLDIFDTRQDPSKAPY